MNRNEPDVFGTPPDLNIRHELRVYALSMLFAVLALLQWIIIGHFSNWRRFKVPEERFGYWIVGTFFGMCILSCTPFGRKFPGNVIMMLIIVESSTLYIAMEQQNTKSFLFNVYTGLIVVTVVVASILWGAYFPMRVVPGDLTLSLLIASANIMLIIFFLNVHIFESKRTTELIHNFFAVFAVNLIMYSTTIIHDRQFNVPKNEYLYLSVMLFVGHMVLHKRVLALSPKSDKEFHCEEIISRMDW